MRAAIAIVSPVNPIPLALSSVPEGCGQSAVLPLLSRALRSERRRRWSPAYDDEARIFFARPFRPTGCRAVTRSERFRTSRAARVTRRRRVGPAHEDRRLAHDDQAERRDPDARRVPLRAAERPRDHAPARQSLHAPHHGRRAHARSELHRTRPPRVPVTDATHPRRGGRGASARRAYVHHRLAG